MLETSGKISFDDRQVAKIISRVAGRIEGVWVLQWDNVRQGEPVVTLYSPDYMTGEAEYLQAVATTKIGLGRTRSQILQSGGLDGRGVAPQAGVIGSDAQGNRRAARAQRQHRGARADWWHRSSTGR